MGLPFVHIKVKTNTAFSFFAQKNRSAADGRRRGYRLSKIFSILFAIL